MKRPKKRARYGSVRTVSRNSRRRTGAHQNHAGKIRTEIAYLPNSAFIPRKGDRAVDKNMWFVYSALAGLCWGTYVPFVQQGIAGLQRNSLGSFLCVGVAYFLIAVLFPLAMFMTVENPPQWNGYGITFATLAGVAGALGALCVIFANRSAAQVLR